MFEVNINLQYACCKPVSTLNVYIKKNENKNYILCVGLEN